MMAIRSGFFNSVNGDRRYKADFFAEYFSSFIANGVFPNPSTGLQVIANDDMTVTLKPGKAWINGYYLSNDADYTLQLDVADGVLNRIDRIVLQLNYSNREILPVVKKGTFASSPVAPSLQRDADAYEIALADVFINKGAVSISQANITDLRLNSELCGIVHGAVNQVDTTTIFNQYTAWFNSVKDGTEQEISDWQQQVEQTFNDWFDTVKGILEGDVATNLANRIATLEQDFASHQADDTAHGIGDKSQLLTTDKTTIVSALNELFTNVSNGKSLVGGAITDVDDSVVIPTDPTFNDLAIAIGQISTGKKWASGSVTDDNGTITVTGLDFLPNVIVVYSTLRHEWLTYIANTQLMHFLNGTWFYYDYIKSSGNNMDVQGFALGDNGTYVNNTGFSLSLGGGSQGFIYNWYAYE